MNNIPVFFSYYSACIWLTFLFKLPNSKSFLLGVRKFGLLKIFRKKYTRPSPLFCLASNAFPDIGSVGRNEKKNLKKKITRSLGIK